MTTDEFIKKANKIIDILNGLSYEDGVKLLLYVLSLLITKCCEEEDYDEVIDESRDLLYKLVIMAESKKGGEG